MNKKASLTTSTQSIFSNTIQAYLLIIIHISQILLLSQPNQLPDIFPNRFFSKIKHHNGFYAKLKSFFLQIKMNMFLLCGWNFMVFSTELYYVLINKFEDTHVQHNEKINFSRSVNNAN